MDPEIDEVGRSDYKIGVGHVKEFKWECGGVVWGLGVLMFPYERQS
jgi:hypothetical protein